MAFKFDANGSGGISGSTPGTGAEAIFRLKALLKLQGWTVTQSSDGTTWSLNNGDTITIPGSGPGGMANSQAWFVIKAPDANGHAFTFQNSTSAPGDNSQWRVVYSGGPDTGFVINGATSATVVPSALDGVNFVGTGTDSSPGYISMLGTDAGYRMNALAGDSASGYSWLLMTNVSASPISTALSFDAMRSGSTVASDADPAVVYFGNPASPSTIFNTDFTVPTTGPVGPECWYGKAAAAPSFGPVAGLMYATNAGTDIVTATSNVFPAGGGVNSNTGLNDMVPIPYGNIASAVPNSGWKGVSQLYYWVSVTGTLAYGTPFTVVTPNDFIAVSSTTTSYMAIPWNGTTVLL